MLVNYYMIIIYNYYNIITVTLGIYDVCKFTIIIIIQIRIILIANVMLSKKYIIIIINIIYALDLYNI